jgi:predicted nicotinamide N-methyase
MTLFNDAAITLCNMEGDRPCSRVVSDDTLVLAHALARVDPDALIRACRIHEDDVHVHHENESTVATRGGGAPVVLNKTEQERLARALNASMKYSKAYASMTARRAVKAIERHDGDGEVVLEDALAETLTACAMLGIGLDDEDAKANASSSSGMCDDGGWCVKAFMYDVDDVDDDDHHRQRVGCVEHRETREEYALGLTDADCVAARTRRDALAGSTGAFAWSAGFVAGEIVMNYGDAFVRGRRCVELGSGTGVTGTVLARSGPRALTLTDRDETTLANLCETLRVNREMDGEECCEFDVVRCDTLADAVRDEATMTTTPTPTRAPTRVCPLDWERASASEMAALNADFILAADCAYDPTLIPGLVRALRGTLGVLTDDDDCTDNDAKLTPLKTLDAPSAERALQTEYSIRPFALVLSAVRQPETMDTLISSLETARLHPVDVTSAIDAMRADPSARGFLFARAARSHAHDAIRAFACSASSSA